MMSLACILPRSSSGGWVTMQFFRVGWANVPSCFHREATTPKYDSEHRRMRPVRLTPLAQQAATQTNTCTESPCLLQCRTTAIGIRSGITDRTKSKSTMKPVSRARTNVFCQPRIHSQVSVKCWSNRRPHKTERRLIDRPTDLTVHLVPSSERAHTVSTRSAKLTQLRLPSARRNSMRFR